MGNVRLLPQEVAGRIAAGEVVERPASVVKELVENALDAGAERVETELAGGGVKRIAVSDDGEGMEREDAPVAFAHHATSKISRADDLLAIRTLGFRGEALAAIAAVARVRLVTRRRSDGEATVVEVEGGGPPSTGVTGAPPGTAVEVRDLFFNTPARRKFLRQPGTEIGHVSDVLLRIAGSRPGLSVRLVADGRELWCHPGVDSLGERVRQLFGGSPSAWRRIELAGPGIEISGFAGDPRQSVASARQVITYVNGRFVRDRMLSRAVLEAYRTFLLRGRYPRVVLSVDLRPEEVDVNVHPGKLEVRFRRGAFVYEAVHRAVRRAISSPARPLPSVAREEVAAWPPPAAAPSAPARHAGPEAAGELPGRGGFFSTLRVVGQLFEGFLICEAPDALVLIDQHAAQERVVFERLREQYRAGGVEMQRLLLPQVAELSPEEVEALSGAASALTRLGFDVEPFGATTVTVRAVPALLGTGDCAGPLRAVAGELQATGGGGGPIEEILSRIACHSAVRSGRSLDPAEVGSLLRALDQLDVAAHCPHGRPAVVSLGRAEVERLFARR